MDPALSVAPRVDFLCCLGIWFEVASRPLPGESSETRDVVWNFSGAPGTAMRIPYSRIRGTGWEGFSGNAQGDRRHACKD